MAPFKTNCRWAGKKKKITPWNLNQWKRLTSSSESRNKKPKLKSCRTNPSLVDTKPGNTIGLIKLIGSVCPERRPACQSNTDVCAVINAGTGSPLPSWSRRKNQPDSGARDWTEPRRLKVPINQGKSWVFLTVCTTPRTSGAARRENNRYLR